MTSVVVRGARIPLLAKNALGAGGEATVTLHVHRGQRLAIKVFRAPSVDKARKIERLMSLRGALPASVVTPVAPALDEKTGEVVGYAMEALPAELEPLAQLSSRAFRGARGIGKREVARILIALADGLAAIHRAGAVVGDLNDQNELFGRGELRFIDADSFQLGELGCTVATEAFLDPRLYGPDLRAPCLAARPRTFSIESDAYAFAVLAFRALTGVHPYGGVSKELPTLPERASARASVFQQSVTLPRAAREGIELLSRDLEGAFRDVFEGGRPAAVSRTLLAEYENAIVRCSCGLDLPASRLPCPRCAAKHASLADRSRGVDATEILSVRGTILAVAAAGDAVVAVAVEGGDVVLHEAGPRGARSARIEIETSRAGYEAFASSVAVALFPVGGAEGVVVDLASRRADKVSVEFGRGRVAFALAGRGALRVTRGWVLASTRGGGETPIATVVESQARIAGNAASDLALVSERIFGEHRYRILAGRASGEVSLLPLEVGEALTHEELAVAADGVAVLRRTMRDGKAFVRTSLFRVAASPETVAVRPVAHAVAETWLRASGETIALGLLVGDRYLVATDRGLVREDLTGGAALELPLTAPYVREGSLLALSPRGLLAATGGRVVALKLSHP